MTASAPRSAASRPRPGPPAGAPFKGRLVAAPATSARPIALPVPPPPQDPPAVPSLPFSRFGAYGAALVAAAVLGLVLNFTMPWIVLDFGSFSITGLELPDAGSRTFDRDELADFARGDYISALIDWPLFAYIGAIVAGVALAAADLVPMSAGIRRGIQTAAAAGAVFVGFILLLTGTRWLGVMIVSILNPLGELYLHVAPYANLALGLAVTVASLLVLRDLLSALVPRRIWGVLPGASTRLPAATLGLFALALLLLPLLPFATIPLGGQTYYVDESDLDELAEGRASDARDAGRYYTYARNMLWLSAGLTALALPFLYAERTGRQSPTWAALGQIHLLGLVPILIGVVFTLLFYVNIPDLAGPGARGRPGWNYLLPLAWLGALGLHGVYALRVLRPMLERRSAAALAPRAV